MACYRPLTGWKKKHRGRNGGYGITFRREESFGIEMTVPCGQCVGCRLERSRQWAIRCMHESAMHRSNSFITLTYSNEHLPHNGSLDLEHFQLFMKRFRKAIWPNKIRFYHCGEYGERLGRPHYHACIFGYDFPDKYLWQIRKAKDVSADIYRSKELERLWPYGYSSIGEVTFESAAYVARYIMKKVTGELQDDHYRKTDKETGETWKVRPEYTTMSRRPGIGYSWYRKYGNEVYPDDSVVVKKKEVRPPRYYDQLLRVEEPGCYDKVIAARRRKAFKGAKDQTPERLRVREKCAIARIKMLKRELPNNEI